MSNYALANTTAQWFAKAYPGKTMTPNCGTLHTTESTSWPGYSGGAVAPNYTALPDIKNKKLIWRAHFPDEMSARALVNLSGGVETNTANNVQVELIGTCDPRHATTWGSWKAGVDYIYWPIAPDWCLEGVAAFIIDQYKRHGTPVSGVTTWKPYPASYGSNNGVRMSFADWRIFKGWCGHQHVPENLHGDPGALDFAKILAFAKAMLVVPAPAPTPVPPKDPASPIPNLPAPKPTSPYTKASVKALQVALHTTVDGKWGSGTDSRAQNVRAAAKGQKFNVKLVQAAIGVKADGVFGPISKAALKKTVIAIQKVLKVSADGAWGPKTDAAYLKFRTQFLNKF